MKVCAQCKKNKSLEQFARRTSSKDGRVGKCKACQKAYHARWYDENKEQCIRLVRVRQKHNAMDSRVRVLRYLSEHTCVDCPEADPVVLAFDHVRGRKSATISKLIHDGATWKRILREIAKCEVRCANCHARKTAKQFNWYRLGG